MARLAISDWPAVGVQVAQAANVNARQQAARLHIVGIALENFLRFGDRVVDSLRLPIHLGQALADDRRLRIERVGLLVKLDGLRGVFGLAGVLVLLLVDVAHREVVVGVGAAGSSGGRGDFL